MTMVARAGGYYGKVFRGERGVTQSDTLSPTILMWWWMQSSGTGHMG